MNVLILEDHEFQRRFAVRLLKECGVTTVYEAGTGEDALSIVRDRTVQVVVCDLQTPGMDGIQFLRHIAAEKPAPAVIIASALDRALINSVEEMARRYHLTLLGVTEKPLNREKLEVFLRKLPVGTGAAARRTLDPLSVEEIRQGIDDGGFLAHFQPKVSFSHGELVGVEALCRYGHPVRGTVFPDSFIDVAERNGLIDGLTYAILTKSLQQCRQWFDQKRSFRLAVNLSPHSLSDVLLADRLDHIVRDHQVPAEKVIFEVTETAIAADTARCIEVLTRLRMKGFGLAIDDFGTGYSSIQHLSHIPFTELKLDYCFVHGAANNSRLRAIIESSIDLARKLNLTTVAEGVETEEEWEFLSRCGCDVAQGYLVGKPMPADALPLWSEQWRSSFITRREK